MRVINKNSRYHRTFDGEMNFAVLPFQLLYCNLATSIVVVVCTSPWELPNWFTHKGPPWPFKTHLSRIHIVFVKDSVYHGPWEVSHEREARVSSAEGARVSRRRKMSEASFSPEAQEVLRSKTESLNIHIFLCADLECQFKEKKWIKHRFFLFITTLTHR